MAGEQENLKKLVEACAGRLRLAKEFAGVTGKITEALESKSEEAAEIVDGLTAEREELLAKIKKADAEARRCESRLGESHGRLLGEVKAAARGGAQPGFKQGWAAYLLKNFTEYRAAAAGIKEADKKNMEAARLMLEDMKSKLKAVKENKKLMDKFSDGLDSPAVGILMNEKK